MSVIINKDHIVVKSKQKVMGEGPQTSLCTISRIEVVTSGVFFKWNMCILALIQYSQEEQTSSIMDKERDENTFLRAKYRILELGCLSLWCQSKRCCGLTDTKVEFLKWLKEGSEDKSEIDGIG